MLYNVYLRSHILPYEIFDSRAGTIYTTTGFSTESQILIGDGGFAGIPSQSTTWVGGIIGITSGTYAGLSADIALTYYDNNTNAYTIGSKLIGFDLAQAFPSAPTGASFFLARRNTNPIQYSSYVYQISKFTQSISFSTSINEGFDICSIELGEKFSLLGNIYSSLIGMNVIVEDQNGHRCFDGIVVEAAVNGNGGNLSCVGYGQTFGWFSFDRYYDTTATNTSTKILRDICAANPYISTNVQGIDRNSAWDTAQQSVAGIGPINFGESAISGKEAINRVLELGKYGVSLDGVSVMFYGNYPTLYTISDNVTQYDYTLTRNNYEYKESGFNLKGSVADTATLVHASYTTDSGDTLFTPYATNRALITTLGLRRKGITSNNNGGLAIMTAVVRVANNDFSDLISSDKYTISNYVTSATSNLKVPVYYIKAGDRIKIEPSYGYENIYKNATMNATSFIVGATSFDTSSGVMTLNPVKNPVKSEIFAARLKT